MTTPVLRASRVLARRFVADERGTVAVLIAAIIFTSLTLVITTSLEATISGVQSDNERVKSWSGTITYDQAVVHIVGATAGDSPYGAPEIDYDTPGVVTIGGVASGAGAHNGTHVLARLKVKSVGQDGQSTALTLSNVEFRDATGAVITGVSLTHGLVTLDYTPTPVPGLTVSGVAVLGVVLVACPPKTSPGVTLDLDRKGGSHGDTTADGRGDHHQAAGSGGAPGAG